MKKTIITLASFGLSILPAHAAIIAQEAFAFTGPAVAGDGSGSGWSNVWSAASGNFEIATGSLDAGDLLTSGNRVVSQTNGANIAARQFSGAPSSGDFWASIVVNTTISSVSGGLTFSNNATEGLHLLETTFLDRARFGFGINGSDFVYRLDGREGSFIAGSVAGATASPTLLVAHFDVTNGVFNMWADPEGLGGSAPIGGVVASNVSFKRTGTTFANDVTYAGLFASWGSVQLDEVRLGTTFADVAPIPEPSTYALLAGILCFIGILLRRRKGMQV